MPEKIPRCYAARRLNPFRGVVQVVETPGGRAISLDGSNWEIQIKAEKPDDLWGSVSPGRPVIQYLRFGLWSAARGMRRIPAHPLLDLSAMLSETELLVGQLQQCAAPCTLADRFECWLLDGQNRMPLALLASSTSIRQLQTPSPLRWRCCETNRPDFDSSAAQHASHPTDADRHPNMHTLERLVAAESGQRLAQWFERTEDGCGAALAGPAQLSGRRLPAESFPPLLLRSDWADPGNRQLVADYLGWLAPALLTLQQIPDQDRALLERQACGQAMKLAEYQKLYPRIIDRKIIDSALVEAKLRRARGE